MATLTPTTPKVFEPLWSSTARFLGAYGGRGSAKSWDRAQAVVLGCVATPGLRVACVREVQNSLKDSVYQLIVDTIHRLGVSSLFTILEAEIRGPGGGLIVFKGMRDQNAEAIKSLEGFDIVWWEEAQGASQRSLDVLRPTIRKAGSQLWFTWNPRKRSDPVDVFLRQSGLTPEQCTLVCANWWDNPWFSAELNEERLIDKAGDQDRYKHIWEGAYEAESDAQMIGAGVVQKARQATAHADLSDAMILGVDVARFGNDSSVIYPRRGFDARTMPFQTFERIDTMQLVGRVIEAKTLYKADAIFVDEGGIGGGVIDRLRQLNHDVVGVNFGGSADRHIPGHPKCANKRSEIWSSLHEALKGGLAIPDSDRLETDLTGPLFAYDGQNAKLLESKKDMKKRGVASPDIGDALALTYAYPVEARALLAAEEARQDDEYDPFWR